MGLGMSTTKQTENGTDFTDYPIVTLSLLIFSKVLHSKYFFLSNWGIKPLTLCARGCASNYSFIGYNIGEMFLFFLIGKNFFSTFF